LLQSVLPAALQHLTSLLAVEDTASKGQAHLLLLLKKEGKYEQLLRAPVNMSETSCYRKWLAHVAELVGEIGPEGEQYEPANEQAVLARVLNDIFEEPHNWDLSDEAEAVRELNELLGRDAPDTTGLSTEEAWELVLEAAMLLTVSEVSVERKTYIQHILSMEEDVQVTMKQAIETYMQERQRSPRKPERREATLAAELQNDAEQDDDVLASPTKSNIGSHACRSCAEMQRLLEEARKRYSVLCGFALLVKPPNRLMPCDLAESTCCKRPSKETPISICTRWRIYCSIYIRSVLLFVDLHSLSNRRSTATST
jgi:hypothetical protein